MWISRTTAIFYQINIISFSPYFDSFFWLIIRITLTTTWITGEHTTTDIKMGQWIHYNKFTGYLSINKRKPKEEKSLMGSPKNLTFIPPTNVSITK